jgi:hydrogenase maturation protease
LAAGCLLLGWCRLDPLTPRTVWFRSGAAVLEPGTLRVAWWEMAVCKLILGVGNPYRHDDGLGWAVAHMVHAVAPPGWHVRMVHGEATELLAAWAGADQVLLIDALSAHLAPGSLWRFDAATPLPAQLASTSSHTLSLAQAVELARTLGVLPPHLIILGIQGADFTPGEGLSPQVASALPRVVAALLAELT